MSVLLQFLKVEQTDLLDTKAGKPIWKYKKVLDSKSDKFFHPLVKSHLSLNLLYSVLCTQIKDSVEQKQGTRYSKKETQKLTHQLITMQAFTETLIHIHHYYLDVPSEVSRLQKNQEFFRNLLRLQGISFEPSDYESNSPKSITKEIRDNTAMLNWPRLFLVRTRRLLLTLEPIIAYKHYTKAIAFFDFFLGPLVNYLSWIFYVPRLLANLFLFAKHLLPGSWMCEKEKNLPLLIRIQVQLQRRWFESLNDSVWMTAGLLGCFLLIGTPILVAAGMYLTIACFLFDALMASMRAYIELSRLHKLLEESNRQLLTKKGAKDENALQFQLYLNQRYSFERNLLLLRVISTSILFLGMLLALPTFSAMPIIPLVGAIIVITVTLLTYLVEKWLRMQSPKDEIKKDLAVDIGKGFATSSYRMFQSADSQKSSNNARFEQDVDQQQTQFAYY